MDLDVRHVIQVLLKQVQDMHARTEELRNNTEIDEAQKNSAMNFYGYHMLVLSILLDQLGDKALELYPDAINLVDWAKKNYQNGVENKLITPCGCPDCYKPIATDVQPEPVVEVVSAQ